MRELSPEEILRLLEGNEHVELIGAHETQTVDFKLDPYRRDETQQRKELAKDVSALPANDDR
jgi:hypothetical protein